MKPKFTPEEEITFNMVDKATVDRLRRTGDIKLPSKKINVPKDMRWNTRQMASKLLAGINAGDSIPKMANSLAEVIDANHAGCVRNARTMVTGAECVGRLDSYTDLAGQGVVMHKVWVATPDERTREEHLELDGETAAIYETFSNGLMYPGDPNGDPSEVWNCRCTVRSEIVGFVSSETGELSLVKGQRDETMHDKQIEEQREERQRTGKDEGKDKSKNFDSITLKDALGENDYIEFMPKVNDADNLVLYEKYANDAKLTKVRKGNGCYYSGTNRIDYSLDAEREGIDKFSTLAHEYSHYFDARLGKMEGLSFGEIDLINERCKIGSGITKLIKDGPSQSDAFLSNMRKDMEALKKKGLTECYSEFRQSDALRNATRGIQDALDGFYGTQKVYAGWGHGNLYYNRGYNRRVKGFGLDKELKQVYNELGFDASNQTKVKNIYRQYEASSEAWANIGSAVTCGGPELEAFEKYMPNALAAYKKIIGKVK